MAEKPTLLVVGDGGVPTGFGRVIESILSRIADRYDVHHVAVNYKGDPYDCNWRMYPAIIGGDPFGVGRIGELMEKVCPDLVLTVGDLWIQEQYLSALFKSCPEARVVTYSPIDAGPVDPEWLRALPRVRAFVVYTEFGRSEVTKALSETEAERIVVIPHGVDTRRFYPIANGDAAAAQAKLQLKITKSPDEESFVVLNANRNQPRKRIDLTLKGFAEFAQGTPPWVKLLLHMGQTDAGWDLVKLARRLGIEKRVILSGPADGRRPSISDERLNLIYNASDVGLNTSGGEGWGLPALEHAATGRAQIVPRHSACRELWEEAAVMLDVHDTQTQPETLTDFHFTRPDDVARALGSLYEDPSYRQEVSTRCFEVATRAEYAWDAIAVRWDHLFQSVLNA